MRPLRKPRRTLSAVAPSCITCIVRSVTGRTDAAKSAFYARLAELLAERIELRTEDLAVILVENERTDWSFGRGQASYVVIPREQWR